MTELLAPMLLLTIAVTFLAPGVAVGLWLHRYKKLSSCYVIPLAGLTGSLLGYVTFWCYLLHPLAGRWMATLLTVSSWLIALWLLNSSGWRKVLRKIDVWLPLTLMVGTALFYTGIMQTCRPNATAQSCYVVGLPIDNDIPKIFAANIEKAHTKDRIGDWQGSDRPPLQSGVVLSNALFTSDSSIGTLSYQVLATLLQCLWVPAVWLLGRALKLPLKKLAFIFALTIPTGFFFFNSIFVWPKLLAASFVLLAFCLLFFEKRSKLTWTLAGLATGAALLAHASAGFTLIPIAIIALLPRYRAHWKTIILAISAVLVTFGPWLLYQKYYDPPGDRLPKWHLAGIVPIDNRSFTETIVESYHDTSPVEIAKNKLSNLRELFGRIPSESKLYGEGKLAQLRDADFRYVLVGLGLFNLGWVALLFRSVRQKLKQVVNQRNFWLLFTVAGSSLVIWILALFLPRAATIHQGSYATMMLLFVGLAAILSTLPQRLRISLVALQFIYFSVVWVGSVLMGHPLEYSQLVGMLIGLAGISAGLWYMSSTKLSEE